MDKNVAGMASGSVYRSLKSGEVKNCGRFAGNATPNPVRCDPKGMSETSEVGCTLVRLSRPSEMRNGDAFPIYELPAVAKVFL